MSTVDDMISKKRAPSWWWAGAATLMFGQAFASGACAQAPTASTEPIVVTDPEVALKDPIASDPIFWWRYSSFITQAFEPPPSFYWPVVEIKGDPAPFFLAAAANRGAISPKALGHAADWAEAHNSTALIVIQNNRVQLERYWGGMRPDVLTNIRAITRSIVPVILGFAVADGNLRLSDPISRFIGEWKNDPRGSITVRQLAENVSGLEASPSGPPVYGNKDLRLVYSGDVTSAALAFSFSTAAGTHFAAAQENIQLLSLVIERATGQPIATLATERLWKPMHGDGAALQLDRPGGVARTMCCMRTTPHDLARLGVLLLNDGKQDGRQILPPGWSGTLAEPSLRNPNFGLGMWLGSPFNHLRSYDESKRGMVPQSEPFLADDVRFMEGGGYRELYIVPSRKLVILRLGTQSKGWDNAFLVNTVIRGMRSTRSGPAAVNPKP